MNYGHSSTDLRESQQKSIPSKVFFNHFFAINYHLLADDHRFDLKRISYYNNLKRRNDNLKLDIIRKLLWNSWSTEYAFNLSKQVDNVDYYKFALHWNFPQAYYSVYLSMTAFHETQGIANDQHEKSIKQFGNSIKDGHYPRALSFYASGLHEQFSFQNLSTFNSFPPNFSGLSRIESLEDAQAQIAAFLKSTRTKNAEHKREKLREAKDKKFLTNNGEFRKKFTKAHWDFIYQTIPVTTLLNLMYRLRIKANYHDVEAFIHADIDFHRFHDSLGSIISYLNFVHEAYVLKVIGRNDFEKILHGFPNHLNASTAVKRYQTYCK